MPFLNSIDQISLHEWYKKICNVMLALFVITVSICIDLEKSGDKFASFDLPLHYGFKVHNAQNEKFWDKYLNLSPVSLFFRNQRHTY